MHKLAQLDQRYIWHPFTQMRDWLRREPLVIVSGAGAILRDADRREYLDANASIWTNLHGHNHPRINAAIRNQLKAIAHSSALGLANEPASLLASELVKFANPTFRRRRDELLMPKNSGKKTLSFSLSKVFFSDDGSTAMEVALKMAYEFARRTRGIRHPKFLSLDQAYHGDTVGAMSLGHNEIFHSTYAGLTFASDKAMSPYCYRCPYNRAKPERADAREYRKCNWECVDQVEEKFARQARRGKSYAAMVIEPLIQGAAGMIPQPPGWLRRVTEIVRGHGAQLIADEVMTGFGRTGDSSTKPGKVGRDFSQAHEKNRTSSRSLSEQSNHSVGLFACHGEGVQPDFLALAKGMTGGYLPMAATLTTQEVFNAFLGSYSEFKTFFHGHSFTGNQLGAAAALASLRELQTPASISRRIKLEHALREQLSTLWTLPNIGDIRRVGLIAGIELVSDWRNRKPLDLRKGMGHRVCEAMTRRGVLTRPIGNVIVLMPPYCMTTGQVEQMVGALRSAVVEVFGK